MSSNSTETLAKAPFNPVPPVPLRLSAVSFDAVEFELAGDEHSRPVVVRVASGCSWRDAVQFPSITSEATETTGDDKLDAAICDRAAEELTRLEAAVLALGARAA